MKSFFGEKLGVWKVSLSLHPSPLVWPAGHSVRDCILTQYLPVYVCTTHIAHVLLPVNWVYLSMTDKIARCRHTYLCLQEEVENVARMNEFMHDHCTWYLNKLLKNFNESILTRNLRNFCNCFSTVHTCLALDQRSTRKRRKVAVLLISLCALNSTSEIQMFIFTKRNATNFKGNPSLCMHSIQ